MTRSFTDRFRRLRQRPFYDLRFGQAASEAPAASFPLDDYSTDLAAAYSVRRLLTAYEGSAMRVRRSSDNTEQDIGFDGAGDLDTAALLTFTGAGDGFVVTWYDQSGNARNVTQATAANQPQIVAAGVVSVVNGQPAVAFDTTNDTLALTGISGGATDRLIAVVHSRPFSGGVPYSFGLASSNAAHLSFRNNGTSSLVRDASAADLTWAQTHPIPQHLMVFDNRATDTAYADGVETDSDTYTQATWDQVRLNTNSSGAGFGGYSTHEFLLWTADMSADRTAIETIVNDYFGIF